MVYACNCLHVHLTWKVDKVSIKGDYKWQITGGIKAIYAKQSNESNLAKW